VSGCPRGGVPWDTMGVNDEASDGAFDALVSALDTSVVVVTTATTAAGGERAGCLVGFHAQCSIQPRQYAVWLSKANRTYRVALLAGHVAVHPLGPGDRDLAELFGGRTGDDVDKFARCDWEPGPGGVPLLTGRAGGRMVLRRTALLDVGGDHSCLVGEPVLAEPPDRRGTGGFTPLRLATAGSVPPGHPIPR
jgi:flavin reductase (DIM6/NTAB) family NADH-FMN oxidoreductase RutF